MQLYTKKYSVWVSVKWHVFTGTSWIGVCVCVWLCVSVWCGVCECVVSVWECGVCECGCDVCVRVCMCVVCVCVVRACVLCGCVRVLCACVLCGVCVCVSCGVCVLACVRLCLLYIYIYIYIYTYCSRAFLVYLFLRLAHISYGRFIGIRYNFKLSTYVQEPLLIGRSGCGQREI